MHCSMRGLAARIATACLLSLIVGPILASSDPPPLPENLNGLLPKLDWDAERNGPLLIVDPTQAPQTGWMEVDQEGNGVPRPIPMPDPATGRYSVAAIAPFYERQPVRIGRMTVLAPTTMTVLRWRNLPRALPSGGLDPGMYAQLLFADLKPGQWQKLGSEEGLGLSDLTPAQQSLFLSIVPENAKVNAVTAAADPANNAYEQVPFTPALRQGMRLRLSRRFNWTFQTENGNGSVGIGTSYPLQQGERQFTLSLDTETSMPHDWERKHGTIFGVPIKEIVPNTQKPSDVRFTGDAMGEAVDLNGAKTVGELIQRIAAVTGLELYCDVRYVDLPVAIRGETARAGDLAQAVCRAVTATFRQIGPAFVLTDDRIGLAVRHQAIGAWGEQMQRLAIARDRKILDALEKSEWRQRIQWDQADPFLPSETIRQKVANQQRTVVFNTQAEYRKLQEARMIPVADLPPAVRAAIDRQIKDWESQPERTMPNGQPVPGFEHQPLRRDKILPEETFHLGLLLPGLGQAELTVGLGTPVRPDHFIARSSMFGRRAGSMSDGAPPPKFLFPDWAKHRALLIRPQSAEDLPKVADAAKAGGFSELWVDIDPTSDALAAAAVREAKARQIVARFVVRVLRAPKIGTDELSRDINARAETLTAALAPLIRSGEAPPFGEIFALNGNRPPHDPIQEWQRQNRLGDWLRCDTAAPPNTARRLVHLADITGLGGLVLRDLFAPGYTAPLPSGDYQTAQQAKAGLDMGYSEEMRLAFLRQQQVDPIDISPFGEQIISYQGASPFAFFNASLPFFPDYGPNSAAATINGVRGEKTGNRAAYEKWQAFRHDLAQKFQTQMVNALLPDLKSVPVMLFVGHDDAAITDFPYFGSVDGPLSLTPAVIDPVTPLPPGSDPFHQTAQTAHQKAKTMYRAITYYPGPPPRQTKDDFLRQMTRSFLRADDPWDGLVLDLSTVSVATALEALSALPK